MAHSIEEQRELLEITDRIAANLSYIRKDRAAADFLDHSYTDLLDLESKTNNIVENLERISKLKTEGGTSQP